MDIGIVMPFLKATENVLSTMAQVKARPGKPFLKEGYMAIGDVTGIIGMASSKAKGSFAITFTRPAIFNVGKNMLGEEPTDLDASVADMVGEITNMVCGGAKKVLSEQGYKFNMATPTTIMGRNHSVYHNTKAPIIVVPFETDAGVFCLELCFNT